MRPSPPASRSGRGPAACGTPGSPAPGRARAASPCGRARGRRPRYGPHRGEQRREVVVRPPPSASARCATGVWIRRSPDAATVSRTGGSRGPVAGDAAPGAERPAARRAARAAPSPEHIMLLHHSVALRQRETARERAAELAKRLPVAVAHDERGCGSTRAPTTRGSRARRRGKVVGELLRRNLARLAVDPDGALARLGASCTPSTRFQATRGRRRRGRSPPTSATRCGARGSRRSRR